MTPTTVLINRLYWALEHELFDEFRAIFAQGLDPNTCQKVSPANSGALRERHLIEVVMDARYDESCSWMLEHLLALGADPRRAIFADGCTPLMKALERNRLGMAKMLLDAGDDVNAVTVQGMSVLHKACMSPWDDACSLDLLQTYGVHLDVLPDEHGRTPLMLAANHNNKARWLLERRPQSVHARDVNGDTALMYAISHHSLSCVQLLISHGASVRICNHHDIDALHQAIEVNRHAQSMTRYGRQSAADVLEFLESFAVAQQASDLLNNIRIKAKQASQAIEGQKSNATTTTETS